MFSNLHSNKPLQINRNDNSFRDRSRSRSQMTRQEQPVHIPAAAVYEGECTDADVVVSVTRGYQTSWSCSFSRCGVKRRFLVGMEQDAVDRKIAPGTGSSVWFGWCTQCG